MGSGQHINMQKASNLGLSIFYTEVFLPQSQMSPKAFGEPCLLRIQGHCTLVLAFRPETREAQIQNWALSISMYLGPVITQRAPLFIGSQGKRGISWDANLCVYIEHNFMQSLGMCGRLSSKVTLKFLAIVVHTSLPSYSIKY